MISGRRFAVTKVFTPESAVPSYTTREGFSLEGDSKQKVSSKARRAMAYEDEGMEDEGTAMTRAISRKRFSECSICN